MSVSALSQELFELSNKLDNLRSSVDELGRSRDSGERFQWQLLTMKEDASQLGVDQVLLAYQIGRFRDIKTLTERHMKPEEAVIVDEYLDHLQERKKSIDPVEERIRKGIRDYERKVIYQPGSPDSVERMRISLNEYESHQKLMDEYSNLQSGYEDKDEQYRLKVHNALEAFRVRQVSRRDSAQQQSNIFSLVSLLTFVSGSVLALISNTSQAKPDATTKKHPED